MAKLICPNWSCNREKGFSFGGFYSEQGAWIAWGGGGGVCEVKIRRKEDSAREEYIHLKMPK